MSEAIIEKVRKLIKLGTNEGAAEGERDNAMRMAYALLAKHNLSMSDMDVQVEKRVESFLDIWQDKYMANVGNAMAKLFFCYCYRTKKFGSKDDRLFFVGKEGNTETAKVMTEYLIKSIRSEMSKRKVGSSFANGATAAIQLRVRELIEKPSEEISSSMALAIMSVHKTEEQANLDFIKNAGTELVAAKSKATRMNANEYHQGREYGEKVNLNLQVDASSSTALPKSK